MRRHNFLGSLFVMFKTVLVVRAFQFCPSTIHFGTRRRLHRNGGRPELILSAANNDNDQDIIPPSSSNEDKAFHRKLQQRYEEIQVENTRNYLEKQHIQSFLKKQPVKLPYKVARKWVQDNLGVTTKEEFEDFVAMGYIQTPYIPKHPEEYYTRTLEWISWDHFLNDSLEIEPRRGQFD